MRLGLMMVALAVALPAQAQRPVTPLERTIRMVDSIAFDPVHFFEWRSYNMVEIRYRGDDFGWPVYTIAVRSGCTGNEPRPACYAHRVARMLRAPIGSRGAERPRWRGQELVQSIFAAGARSERAIKQRLDQAGLDWLEADLQTCPGAIDMLARAEAVRWGPYTPPPDPEGRIVVRMHSDTIEVGFRVPEGWATWKGGGPEGSAGRWAFDFAALIEPCWKPAIAPAPWRRVPPTD